MVAAPRPGTDSEGRGFCPPPHPPVRPRRAPRTLAAQLGRGASARSGREISACEELAAGRELGSRSEVEFVGSGLLGRRGGRRAPPRSCRSGPGLVTVVMELPIGWAPSGGGGLKPRGEPVGRPSAGVPDSLAGPTRGAPPPVGPPAHGPSAPVLRPCRLPGGFSTPPPMSFPHFWALHLPSNVGSPESGAAFGPRNGRVRPVLW